MSRRKGIKPGDLILHHKVMYDAAVVTRYGLVVAVRYPREGEHIGCEDRVSVFWTDTHNGPRFSDECDCGLLLVDELLEPVRKKSDDREKSVYRGNRA